MRSSLRIELGKVLTDNLAGQVAFHTLCAGIPIGDDAIRVQHINRVVGHALHEQAEAALALEQGFLRGFPFGHVTGDFHEADRLASIVTNDVEDRVGPKPGAAFADAPAFRFVTTVFRGLPQNQRGQAVALILRREEP